ncbi:MAG TPA: FKBP-type peptidyl-prolyl cis-trans isomerase [Solirubrobacterales bacterium]|nr:FKBP-type peptidyl-prolyl cis-trans isomerase [Solirubrobacterales bacterium]
MKTLILTIAVCAGLAIAGCGSSSDSSSGSSESTAATTSDSTSAESAGGEKTKPKVTVPKGAPPKQLEIKELEEGTGAEAKAGDEVTVQYVGVSYKNGKEFDSSWSRNEPFPLTLGAGSVIPGWEQGIEGMKVGGRRELIIPPELAYGETGYPPSIAPNETLVFVIDLLEVN